MNNRQSGRRRGRGGQRPQGNGGNPGSGNRIDNRARGNAPQLLEKYKNLARDSQMQGDRVLTEYYLQFADHYFRVVAESRARFEENRPRRDEWQNEDGDQNDGMDGDSAPEGVDMDADEPRPRRNSERQSNTERQERPERQERRPRRDNRRDRDEASDDRAEDDVVGVGTDALPVDILPPAIGLSEIPSVAVGADASNDDADEEDETPRPRRRGRLGTRSAKDTAEV